MKLVISTENKRLSVKLPGDKCDKLFNTLAASILNTEPVPQMIQQAIKRDDIHEKIVPCKLQIAQVKPEAKAYSEHVAGTGYTGFLYIRCPKCGKERGMCAKFPMSEYTCRDCGKKTELENLHKVHFTCECGKYFSYFTNIEDDMFEIACLDCGTPNTVFKNPKTGDYSDEERRTS